MKEEIIMKTMRKIAVLLLAICLVVPCFSLITYAADGRISLTDYKDDKAVETGKTVDVKVEIVKTNSTIGKVEITLSYDTNAMKFVSGTGVTEPSAGTLKYSGDATNETGSSKSFNLKFETLNPGTTVIEVTNAVIKNVAGTTMNYTKGSSTIVITGEPIASTVSPSTEYDKAVEVDGKDYKFAGTIPSNEIPEGFVEATLEYDAVNHNVVYSEAFDAYLAYLVDEDGVGAFFLFEDLNAKFFPYINITISDQSSIIVLRDVSDVMLPNEFKKTEIESSEGYKVNAWENETNPNFYIIYAKNNHGEKTLYQFDYLEGTYQRFNAPEIEKTVKSNSLFNKVNAVLGEHLDIFVLAVAIGLVLFVIIIIVLGVKLYNRNAELDEIYDEYGLGDEEDEKEDDDNDDTEDDVVLDVDDEESESEEEPADEMTLLVQEGMKEVFPEEHVKSVDEAAVAVAEEENTEDTREESTLGAVLAQQKLEEAETKSEENSEEESEEEDEDFLENFSVDFIDLDD